MGLKIDGGNDHETLHLAFAYWEKEETKNGGSCVDLTAPMEDHRRWKALVAAHRLYTH